jgi:hypothetical protein
MTDAAFWNDYEDVFIYILVKQITDIVQILNVTTEQLNDRSGLKLNSARLEDVAQNCTVVISGMSLFCL